MNKLKNSLVAEKAKPILLASSFCLTLAATTANTAQAATVAYSTEVSPIDRILNRNNSVLGLSKFDPSLGTLTDVRVTVVGDYTVELSPFFGYVVDELSEHSIAGSFSAQGGMQIRANGTGIRFATSFLDPIDFDCTGEEDSGFFCLEDETLEVSGTYNGDSSSEVFTSSSLFSRLELNNLVDEFIGTGDFAPGVIELGISGFLDDLMITVDENIEIDSDIFLDGEFLLGPSTVTIEYEFTPAAIPVPAAAWLFGSALLGLAGVKRNN